MEGKVVNIQDIPDELQDEARFVLSESDAIKQGDLYIVFFKKLDEYKDKIKKEIENKIFVYMQEKRLKAIESIKNV